RRHGQACAGQRYSEALCPDDRARAGRVEQYLADQTPGAAVPRGVDSWTTRHSRLLFTHESC
ncbi:MAG: hypothetical protein AAB403_18980, partial [Planctomycetota bacterium]